MKTSIASRWVFFWAGVLLLFCIVHFTDKRLAPALDALFTLLTLDASQKELMA